MKLLKNKINNWRIHQLYQGLEGEHRARELIDTVNNILDTTGLKPAYKEFIADLPTPMASNETDNFVYVHFPKPDIHMINEIQTAGELLGLRTRKQQVWTAGDNYKIQDVTEEVPDHDKLAYRVLLGNNLTGIGRTDMAIFNAGNRMNEKPDELYLRLL